MTEHVPSDGVSRTASRTTAPPEGVQGATPDAAELVTILAALRDRRAGARLSPPDREWLDERIARLEGELVQLGATSPGTARPRR